MDKGIASQSVKIAQQYGSTTESCAKIWWHIAYCHKNVSLEPQSKFKARLGKLISKYGVSL